MKRTNSRIIKLPSIVKAGGELATGLSPEEVEELNARSFDYGRRTAIPTLDDYVIEPFSTAFEERVFTEAVREVGLDSEGILNRRYSTDHLLNDKKFVVSVYPTTRPSYETVLSLTKSFLDTVIADSKAGVTREGSRKIDADTYIFIEYLLNEMDRFRSENSSRSNKPYLAVKDPKTNKEFPLDTEIKEMCVYLELARFANINAKNADGFHDARSLKSRIELFLSVFEQGIINRYGVSPTGLGESQAFDYELSDGSAVRYLFYPKPSTEYGEIYSRLVGRKTKNITASNGDLDILKELAFKDPYEYMREGAGIRVSTETTDKSAKGKTKIVRLSKDGSQEERVYPVFDNEGKVYVRVGNVLDTLGMLTQQHTSTPTKLKIDLFAAPPAYLR
jgi:hypothetical protein